MESDADAEPRRQNHRAQAEGTLWSRAGVDRKTVFVCSVHMPKRLAETPADQQITQQIGSGPFKFVQSEFRPGVKAVYEKTRTTCHARSRRARPLAARWRKLTVSSASRCRTRRLRSMHSSPAKSILWKVCQSICCRYFTRTAISSLRR